MIYGCWWFIWGSRFLKLAERAKLSAIVAAFGSESVEIQSCALFLTSVRLLFQLLQFLNGKNYYQSISPIVRCSQFFAISFTDNNLFLWRNFYENCCEWRASCEISGKSKCRTIINRAIEIIRLDPNNNKISHDTFRLTHCRTNSSAYRHYFEPCCYCFYLFFLIYFQLRNNKNARFSSNNEWPHNKLIE